jgi:hypothetical protein
MNKKRFKKAVSSLFVWKAVAVVASVLWCAEGAGATVAQVYSLQMQQAPVAGGVSEAQDVWLVAFGGKEHPSVNVQGNICLGHLAKLEEQTTEGLLYNDGTKGHYATFVPVDSGQEQLAINSMGFLGPEFDGYPYALFARAVEDSTNPNFADGAEIIFPGLANEYSQCYIQNDDTCPYPDRKYTVTYGKTFWISMELILVNIHPLADPGILGVTLEVGSRFPILFIFDAKVDRNGNPVFPQHNIADTGAMSIVPWDPSKWQPFLNEELLLMQLNTVSRIVRSIPSVP